MSVSSFEEIKKRYNFPHVAIATWRDPADSVLPAFGGPKPLAISAEDAGRPFIPTYKFTPRLPETTDDEESESGDDDGDDDDDDDDDNDEDQSHDENDGGGKAQVDSPMDSPISDPAKEDQIIAENHESCQEICEDESNVRDIDVSPSSDDPNLGSTECNDDATAPQNEGGPSVNETENAEGIDDFAEAPGEVETIQEQPSKENQKPEEQTTPSEVEAEMKLDNVEPPKSLPENQECSTEEQPDESQPADCDTPAHVTDPVAEDSGVDFRQPESISTNGLQPSGPRVEENAGVASEDDHPINAEEENNENSVTVEPECKNPPETVAVDAPQSLDQVETSVEVAPECASQEKDKTAETLGVEPSKEEGEPDGEGKTDQHDSSGEKKVSFAPGTPEPKPTSRKKKNSKNGRSQSKKRVSVPMENLPENIIAIVDEKLKGNDEAGDAEGDQHVEALAPKSNPQKICESAPEASNSPAINDRAISRPHKKGSKSSKGKDKVKKNSVKTKSKTSEVTNFGLGIDLAPSSVVGQELDQTDSFAPPLADTAAVVGENSVENEEDSEESKGNEPECPGQCEDSKSTHGLTASSQADNPEDNVQESNEITTVETSENKSSEDNSEKDQTPALDIETGEKEEGIPDSIDITEALSTNANAEKDKEVADNVGEASGDDNKAEVTDSMQNDQFSDDAPKLPEGTGDGIQNEDNCKDASETAAETAQEDKCCASEEQNEVAADKPSGPISEEGKNDLDETDSSYTDKVASQAAAETIQERTDEVEIAANKTLASDEKTSEVRDENKNEVEVSADATEQNASDQQPEREGNLDSETSATAMDTEDAKEDPVDKPEEMANASEGTLEGSEDASKQEDCSKTDCSADSTKAESLDKETVAETPSPPPTEFDPVAAPEGEAASQPEDSPVAPATSEDDNAVTENTTVQDIDKKDDGHTEGIVEETKNEELGADCPEIQDPASTTHPSDPPPEEDVPGEPDSTPQESASDRPAESNMADACHEQVQDSISVESPKDSAHVCGDDTQNLTPNVPEECEEQNEEKATESQDQPEDGNKPVLTEDNVLSEEPGKLPSSEQPESAVVSEPAVESSSKNEEIAENTGAPAADAKDEAQPAPPPSPTLSKESSRKPRANHWERKPHRRHADEDRRSDKTRSGKRSSGKSFEEPRPKDRPHRSRRHSIFGDDGERQRRSEARKAEEVARVIEEEKRKAEEEELRRIRHEARRAARKAAAEEAARLAKEEEEKIVEVRKSIRNSNRRVHDHAGSDANPLQRHRCSSAPEPRKAGQALGVSRLQDLLGPKIDHHRQNQHHLRQRNDRTMSRAGNHRKMAIRGVKKRGRPAHMKDHRTEGVTTDRKESDRKRADGRAIAVMNIVEAGGLR
ncbi:MAG: hypothetical protein FE78DRAFT_41820 [Acidomyces sp. 'richmondensis']|nr:MAG: hypothetical protein FE78DRAFT_41820 [Acidomyces sp. 'richmondensis']